MLPPKANLFICGEADVNGVGVGSGDVGGEVDDRAVRGRMELSAVTVFLVVVVVEVGVKVEVFVEADAGAADEADAGAADEADAGAADESVGSIVVEEDNPSILEVVDFDSSR